MSLGSPTLVAGSEARIRLRPRKVAALSVIGFA